MANRKRLTKKQQREIERVAKRLSAGQIFAIIMVIVILAVAVFLVWKFILPKDEELGAADGDLRVHFIDVGQGDSIYIEFPDGKSMLIDGYSQSKLMPYLASLNIDKIEYLVLSHTDNDHVNALDEVLGAYTVEKIYMPKFDKTQITTDVFAKFYTAAHVEADAEIIFSGDETDIDGGNYLLDFYVYADDYDKGIYGNAEKINAVSPLIFMTYAGKKVLFTGDGNTTSETHFASRAGDKSRFDVDIMKVPHHGSHTSATAEFLAIVKPEYSVVSVGAGNSHEHPRKVAMDRIKGYSNEIYRTDMDGTVVLTISDTGKIDFKTEKQTENDKWIGFEKAYIDTRRIKWLTSAA